MSGFKVPGQPLKFGLNTPKSKKSLAPLTTKTAFDDDDEDEDQLYEGKQTSKDLNKKYVNAMIAKEHKKTKTQRQTQMTLQKAIEQDSSIMQYDEVYEDVSNAQKARDEEEKRKELNMTRKDPKYIKGLMKAAAKRNLEGERRYERKSIRERKDEDQMYEDKEKFITPAYKEKMEKLEEAEAEINRRDALDQLQDVTKQSGVAGFYRHFLNDNYGNGAKKPKTEAPEVKKEAVSEPAETEEKEEEQPPPTSSRQRHDSSSSDSSSSGSGSDDVDSDGPNLGSDDDEDNGNDETQKFNEKFGITKKFSHPAAPSTTMTKMTMRSRVTAGGAGVETEVDWDYQVAKLKCIFKVRNSDEDLDVARRRYFQRQAVREEQGGWMKVLTNK